MKKNRLVIVIGIFFLCNLWSVVEDKDVQSVLPVKNIQRRANVGGICTPYVDHNYYLYEGEAALLLAHNNPLFPPNCQYAPGTYDSKIIRVYEAKTFNFDGNTSLGPYLEPVLYAGVIIEAIAAGKTTIELKVNNAIPVSIPVVVLDPSSDYLEKMDKDAFFTSIDKDDLTVFNGLLQRGVSLSLVNENNETVLVALVKSGHIDLIQALVSKFSNTHNYLMMIKLLRIVVSQKNALAAALILQYIPLDVFKKFDTDGSLQNYVSLNAVVGAIEGERYTIALNVLRRGYPIASRLNEGGLNPLLSAIVHGNKEIALTCIEKFSAQDLGVTNLEGLTPLMVALQSWKSDHQQGEYQEVVEKLLAKMEAKDLVCKDRKAKTAWDYAIASTDPETVVLVKKYIQGKISFPAQEIVDRIQQFAPTGVWTVDLLEQAAQFIGTVQDLGSRDKNGNTALMLALQQKKHYVSQVLIQNIPFPVLVTVNRLNESALQLTQKWNEKKLVKLIMERIKKEERDYFYDGIEGTCSDCVYIPDLEKKRGIISVTACVKGVKGEKSGKQEVQVKPVSYVYNGGGRVTVLKQKVANVFYTARRLDEVFGLKDVKAVAQYGYKQRLHYTTAMAVMQLTPQEFSEVDPQGEIKKFVQETGYFAAAVESDLALAQALIAAHYDPNILNAYRQNPAMTAFQHKSVETGKKIFPLITASSYEQRDTAGNTLLMYVIEARQKDIATILLNAMTPADLIKPNKKGKTVYELLLTAGWKDLATILQQKASQLSLFYTALTQFAYVPNSQGNGGSFTKTDNGMTGAITCPNQLIYMSPAGGLATVVMNQPVNGVPWNTWAAQNGITLSALRSYSTMKPASSLGANVPSPFGGIQSGLQNSQNADESW